eukprot:TRINITY_DN1663_c0_g1_i4.p1 TRINITY_DN1663_c0_g1~~TRINITY_DN1663_c0_g1_i4.p1  ORF type:complete len:397 (+),score=67.85 TRINITY_DN1663_c0_g1_i4:342-1532(+)
MAEIPEYFIYQIKIHQASNLPKADLFGQIDAYIKVYFTDINGDKVLQTKPVMKSYNPVFKSKITGFGFKKDVRVEIWDFDKGSSDEMVGYVNISPDDMPFTKRALIVTLLDSFARKVQSKDEPTTITLSGGCVCDYGTLKRRMIAMGKSIEFDDEKRQILFDVAQPQFALPLYIEIKYEGDRMDIFARCKPTSTSESVRTFGLSIGGAHHKYELKRVTPSDLSINDSSYWKLNDLRFYAPLKDLAIWEATREPVWSQDAGSMVKDHGWHGKMSYVDARALLKDIEHDDDHESIYFMKDWIAFKVDWENSNFDVALFMYTEYAEQGFGCDITDTSLPETARTVRFFGRPVPLGKKTISQRVAIDEMSFGRQLKSLRLDVFKVSSVSIVPIISFVPFY